jgi:glycosyltransferase involved in cell wall biosynthesis
VLTSCASNHLTWENTHAPGPSKDGAIEVLRFASRFGRQTSALNALSRTLFKQRGDRLEEERWLSLQGPELEGFLEHLDQAQGNYDAFLAFTYLYAPTARGAAMVADRCLVIPTAHDEPAVRFGVYRDVFERTRALLCNTVEEAELLQRLWPNLARTRVTGVGIDLPARASQVRPVSDNSPFVLYIGRIERDKGIPELLRFHRAWARRDPGAPRLVLAGDTRMRGLGGGKVEYVGRISEASKWSSLRAASAAIVPSKVESLSLLALEAFAVGTPVVAREESAVLRGHIRRSGAGGLFRDAQTYAEAVRSAMARRADFAVRGRRYAKGFRWDKVMSIYREELGEIVGRTL